MLRSTNRLLPRVWKHAFASESRFCGARIRVFHYATHHLRGRLVFTPPTRRKVRIDGLAQHDLPAARAIDKQALDEVVRCAYQACQAIAGLLQRAPRVASRRWILRGISSPLGTQTWWIRT